MMNEYELNEGCLVRIIADGGPCIGIDHEYMGIVLGIVLGVETIGFHARSSREFVSVWAFGEPNWLAADFVVHLCEGCE